MQEILGNQAGADKVVSNISGEAVEMIQQRLDMQAYIYMSNFAKGQRRSGEIWLSMAKEIYVEEGRKMKTVSPEGKTSQIEMMRPIIGETGEVETENDLNEANFDVDVDVGPSSQSKRAAMVKAITGMLAITDDPQTKQILQSMAIMNMEGEGISDIREYFRKQRKPRPRLLKLGPILSRPSQMLNCLAQRPQKQLPKPVSLNKILQLTQLKYLGKISYLNPREWLLPINYNKHIIM